MRSFPQTFALILNYNCSSETVLLYRQLTELDLDFLHILVIDNNSARPDQNCLKENIPKQYIVINEKNLGYAGGNNVGIEIALKSNAEFIWILNPDIRVDKKTLSTMLETALKDSTLAAVGPRILHREQPNLIFTDGEQLIFDEKCTTIHKNSFKEAVHIPGRVDHDIDYIDGSCLLINCIALKELGKLPEEYFLYFEETDWCFNAKRNGWKLAVNSEAVVYNLTSIKKKIFHFYFMRNKLIFSKKFHPKFKLVRYYYTRLLIKEFLNRFKGKYLRPFFKSRMKGLVAGIIKTA